MPKEKVARFKKIVCRTCKKTIRRFDRSKYKGYKISKADILAAIRRHYKRHHKGKFKEFQKKALKTKRKKGIINKKRGRKK